MNILTRKKSILLMLCLLMVFSAFTGCSGDKSPSNVEDKTTSAGNSDQVKVDSIEIKTSPDKIEYFVGENYDFTGGILTVNKADGTSEEIAMTDPKVTYSTTEASAIGNKSVTLTYGDEKVRVRFTVKEQGFIITFDNNYDGAPSGSTESVSINSPAVKIEDPSREGYSFYNWYTDVDCTVAYNFDALVTQDITLYAKWEDASADYHIVSFDLNYYGGNPSAYAQIVKDGENAITPNITPERTDYTFAGWYNDENGSTVFDASVAIAADTTVYAKWDKSKKEASSYIFEAELTDLTGKSGPGFSGTSSEKNMILFNEGVGASDDRYVSYLYKMGNSLEFYIASDEDVSNVTFVASLSAEMADMTINPDNYVISVNGTSVAYNAINFTNVPKSTNDGACLPFEDYTISTNITLKKGANVIKFVTSNTDNYVGGGTIGATAPLVDCIKLTTDAVLIWDANFNLPMNSNFTR